MVDTAGDGLLVFETRGRLRVRRRYPLLGAPYGAASDLRNGRLWVTLTARNQLVELATSAGRTASNVYPDRPPAERRRGRRRRPRVRARRPGFSSSTPAARR